VIDDAENLMIRGQSPGIPCALAGVRRYLNGYHPSEQTVLGARPSTGKTSYAVEEAIHAATRHHKNTLIFSLEMGRKSIGKRVMARLAQLGLGKLRHGPIVESDYEHMTATRELALDYPLYLDPTAGLSAPEIHARAEAHIQHTGSLDLVIVDFLGIMGSPFGHGGGRGDNQKRLEVGHNALLLRELARDLECHVLLLAQINRGATSRAASRPTMADLKESGSIEEIADNIILLHNASKYDDNAPKDIVELIIAKGRNDSTGSAFAHLDGPTGTWTDHNEAPEWLAAQEPPAPPDLNGW
jgi:replicative DNA helicase